MGNINCCICGAESQYHLFKKMDTHQLMRNLTVNNYTGASYCVGCWTKMVELMRTELYGPEETKMERHIGQL
jgi:hypothetical protein